MKAISVDIGRSYVKVKYQKWINNQDEYGRSVIAPGQPSALGQYSWGEPYENILKFPTIIDYASNSVLEDSTKQTYSFEGKKFIMPSKTITPGISSTSYSFLYNYSPLFIFKALEEAGYLNDIENNTIEIKLYCGLSPADWKRKDEYMERISRFTINDITVKCEISLMAQGVGAINNYLINTLKAKSMADIPPIIACIDGGYYTVDTITFVDGKIDGTLCQSLTDEGVNKIINNIKAQLDSELDLNLPESKILEGIINGKFIARGEEYIGFNDLVTEEVTRYINKLFENFKNKNRDIIGSADFILVCGGLAYVLGQNGVERYNLPKNFVIDGAYAEFGNAIGYING